MKCKPGCTLFKKDCRLFSNTKIFFGKTVITVNAGLANEAINI